MLLVESMENNGFLKKLFEAMHEYAAQNGYELDITDTRYHHEIQLSDPRKIANEKLKTVIRHPIRKA